MNKRSPQKQFLWKKIKRLFLFTTTNFNKLLPPLWIFWHKIGNEWNANPLIDGPNQRKSYQKQIRHLKKIFTTKQISPRSKQHLSTKRWLHICFDLRARYLFSSKRFYINHIRCWKSTKIGKLNSAKSWKLYFRQKKKPTRLQLSTNFRKGRLLKKLVDIHGTRITKCHYTNSIATFIRHRWTNPKKRLFKSANFFC